MSTGTRVEASINARSSCSASPAAAETEGSFKGMPVAFMEFWMGPVTEERVMAEPLAKATSALAVKPWQEPVPRARQLIVRRSAAKLRPAQAKLEPDSAKRLAGLEAPAWRLDPPLLAFAAPVRQ